MAVPVPSISSCVSLQLKNFCKEKNTLAFNRDRCCHLVLCLRLIPFHCLNSNCRCIQNLSKHCRNCLSWTIKIFLFLDLSLYLARTWCIHLIEELNFTLKYWFQPRFGNVHNFNSNCCRFQNLFKMLNLNFQNHFIFRFSLWV
jgi:hypothetical protein